MHPALCVSHRTLGCSEGRSSARWVDFNFFGHQIVAHLVDGYDAASHSNAVDGDPVPVPHFGAALSVSQFEQLASRVKAAGVDFEIEPHVRFVVCRCRDVCQRPHTMQHQGQPGEQWTMFFRDPSGNALEFKAMTTPENLFAKYTVKAG